jgi:hypothetical protein
MRVFGTSEISEYENAIAEAFLSRDFVIQFWLLYFGVSKGAIRCVGKVVKAARMWKIAEGSKGLS